MKKLIYIFFLLSFNSCSDIIGQKKDDEFKKDQELILLMNQFSKTSAKNEVAQSKADNKVNEIVAQGIQEGLNPKQIEERLLREIPDIKRARAISRTEATRAYNQGKKKSAQDWANQTGVNLWKLWIHGGAKEPRIQHILAQDKPIRFDQPFVFNTNGVQVLMDIPGDLNGGPAQTINCSCVVVYVSESYARRNFPASFKI